MMYIKSKLVFLVLLVSFFSSISLYSENIDQYDPILKFYCDGAEKVSTANRANLANLSYNFKATSYYKRIGDNGRVTKTDSASLLVYGTGASIDSQIVLQQTEDKFSEIAFFKPEIFGENYQFNFYPNDSGGTQIAIGFDTDSLMDPKPVGFALIDRNSFAPYWYYLTYPSRKGYERLSYVYHFVIHDNQYIFPDSIIEVGAKSGILSTHHYRLETTVSDFEYILKE